MRWALVAAVCVFAACNSADVTHCPDVDCPKNEVCDNHGGCALQVQLAACAGQPDGASCTYVDETNATIIATQQGANQAGEVGELMSQTVTKLEQSILAVHQQKSAADQVDGAVVQIRDAADQMAAEQANRASTAERLEALVDEIEAALRDRVAAPTPHVNGSVLR